METSPSKDYVSNNNYVLSGKEFENLTQKAKKLGAESLV